MGRRKVFERDQPIEIKRATWSKYWEAATYMAPVASMKGWHRVKLAEGAHPAYHHAMTGAEWIGDEQPPDDYVGSSVVIVPTQRARNARHKEVDRG